MWFHACCVTDRRWILSFYFCTHQLACGCIKMAIKMFLPFKGRKSPPLWLQSLVHSVHWISCSRSQGSSDGYASLGDPRAASMEIRDFWRMVPCSLGCLTLILRRSRTGTVWFYTSTSNKRAARPKLYTKSLTRDLKLMYSRLTVVRISSNL